MDGIIGYIVSKQRVQVTNLNPPRGITKGYLTFQIVGDAYLLRRVGTHSILKKP